MNKTEFDLLMNRMQERAIQDFQTTEHYGFLQEQMGRMENQCECMFMEEERTFALECFEQVAGACRQEEDFVYRRGVKDCVMLLKYLGVLA